jgi:[NiFe] hydrogenase diaphorase moiety large subunit
MHSTRVEDCKAFVETLIHRYQCNPTELIRILREIQDRYRHVPDAAIEALASQLSLPRSRIVGVIEFYSFLHTAPRGRYDVLLSDSISDHMLGKQSLMDDLCRKLGVAPGVTRADGQVSVDNTSCTGLCDQGPAGLVNGYAVTRLTSGRIDRMVPLINESVPLAEWPSDFFAIDDNIRRADLLLNERPEPGAALAALLERGADALLDEIDRSGLRGRGGAGFNTAMKWRFCREAEGDAHYVVCNADEGEPGTFKDRVLLDSYADQVFEGMTLCARIIGARRGFLYLRGEYRYLLKPLQDLLAQRRQKGLLGDDILGATGFNFDIDIHLGAGAYICGEESALIESLEGKRGIPRNRPPYPVTHGYLGRPTVVNNVETLAAAAAIAVHGGQWFAAVGTAKSKGTKILSICGDCARPGIYEYPFGTPIRDILTDCGAGGTLGIQVGGPSGTFIEPGEYDRRLGFEDLATGGSFMIFDASRSLLDIVGNFTHFFAHESCGFCTPCRVGTSLMKNTLDKIHSGHGTAGDLVELRSLCELIKEHSHCGLGHTAANPIIETLERFPDLYEQRLKAIVFEPGFDLDGALEAARQLTGRDDSAAHLQQVDR